MVLKIVYYGPAMSGKTTNLLRLHDLLSPAGRGELVQLDTTDDRTIFFDLLPFFLTAPSGLKIKLKLFTVPGQVKHDATRKAVLQRADGVVFVADSRRAEQGNNRISLENLERNLTLVGIDIDRMPVVVQFNKRDLPDIVPEAEVRARWAGAGIPLTLASALRGDGVVETFALICSALYEHLDSRFALKESHGLEREAFVGCLAEGGAP